MQKGRCGCTGNFDLVLLFSFWSSSESSQFQEGLSLGMHSCQCCSRGPETLTKQGGDTLAAVSSQNQSAFMFVPVFLVPVLYLDYKLELELPHRVFCTIFLLKCVCVMFTLFMVISESWSFFFFFVRIGWAKTYSQWNAISFVVIWKQLGHTLLMHYSDNCIIFLPESASDQLVQQWWQ